MSMKAWASRTGSTFKSEPKRWRTVRARQHWFTASASLYADSTGENGPHGGASKPQLGHRAQQKFADREFFLDLLTSASTKREAKPYLSRFKKSKATPNHPRRPGGPLGEVGQDPPILAGQTWAVQDNPVFRQTSTADWPADEAPVVHLALIKIRLPQTLDDTVLDGLASTISQLNRLGMGCCVVVDTETGGRSGNQNRWVASGQADRIAKAIGRYPGPGSRCLDNFIGVSNGSPLVRYPKLLMAPLRRGMIPVVVPIAYTEGQVAVQITGGDAVRALAEEFASAERQTLDRDPKDIAAKVSLDRLILVDPLGGIPSGDRGGSHVFINMEQEYRGIERGLQTRKALDGGRPVPDIVEDEDIRSSKPGNEPWPDQADIHLDNLALLRDVLMMLPPSSSAIITSPQQAANSSRASRAREKFQVSAVGTRTPKNPLIHNLLTDKPTVSSSLPPGRLGTNNGETESISYPTTFSKRGMPLTLLPDPRANPWTVEHRPKSNLTLTDPRVDLRKLVHLIEDSFDRRLDVDDYLARVNDRIAGVIIAGDYEGGAILTWETPPGVGEAVHRSRLVPYLDKFAVLKRSQGAGGVADILFNAMVRDCFPNGVCWRSRRDNPVNKWYFERARGTWKLPQTNWTMFWTTEGVEEDQQRFVDYEGVCRGVEPSWADHKTVVD